MVVDEIIDTPGQTRPRRALGGAPSYSSLALSSLGYQPGIITHVGDDFPDIYSKLIWDKTGINLEKWIAPGFKTTSYRIDRSGPHRRLWLVARCRELEIDDFRSLATSGKNASIVLNPVAGEISLEVLRDIVRQSRLVFVDSQGFVRRFDEKTGEVSMKSGLDISSLRGVKVLKADSDELTAWTGTAAKDLAVEMVSEFVEIILMTSGPSKVEVYEKGKLTMKAIPFKVSVADTTGAGDIMLSSFAARFTETTNVKEALSFSLTASTLAVRNYGIEKAILEKSEVESKSSLVSIVV